jgi:hypothetical protein
MTVRTDEIALRHFVENCLPTRTSEVADFLMTRQVIPGHRRVMKEPTTVDARRALFQVLIPVQQFIPALALPRHDALPIDLKVARVIRLPAPLTPRLVSAPPAVEFFERLPLAALPAELHVVRLDNRPDGITSNHRLVSPRKAQLVGP